MKRLLKKVMGAKYNERPAKRKPVGNFRPGLETLEDRKLMAGDMSIDDNFVLNIKGSQPGEFFQGSVLTGHDLITIDHSTMDANGVNVIISDRFNGTFIANKTFDFRFFQKIRVDAGDGDDIVLNNLTNVEERTHPGGGKRPQNDKMDELIGGRGHDWLFGGRNSTRLEGGPGNDLLVGGEGGDTYVFSGSNVGDFDEIVEADDADSDTLDFSGNVGVMIDLGATLPQPISPQHHIFIRNSLSNASSPGVNAIENVVGSDFKDTITGNSRDNRLEGRMGADDLAGLSGSDTYVYRSNVSLNLGSDFIAENPGDPGTDLIDFSGYDEQIRLDIGFGGPFSSQQVATRLSIGLTNAQSIENVTGTRHHDRIFGNNLNNVLHGLDGNDQLWGGFGEDTLHGHFGNDSLGAFWRDGQWIDDPGNDTMYGDWDHDTVAGGSGDDKLVGGSGRDDIWGDSGNDRLYAGGAGGSLDSDVDTLHGGGHDGDGDDRFYGMDWGGSSYDWSDQTDQERWNQFWEAYRWWR